jgi:FkbM family methyltransferase
MKMLLLKFAVAVLSTILPAFLKRPIRNLFNQVRGVTGTPLTHEEIAALINKSDPTILEIGCNDGADTLTFLRVLPQAKIYCFEPDPRAIRRFKKKLGSQLDKVKLFEIAISNQTGPISFHSSSGGDLPGGWDLSGSIRRPKNHLSEHPWVKFDNIITVRTCRLDDWCADNDIKQVDFIWMDVQGAEGDVIKGASKTLQKTRFLYTEYNNNELYEGQPSLKILLALLPSFKVVTRYPDEVLLKNMKIA